MNMEDPNFKSIRGDSTHLIFGNSELTVRWKKNEVFCKLGWMNGWFKNEGLNYEIMIGPQAEGEEEKKRPLVGYEIHSIEFE